MQTLISRTRLKNGQGTGDWGEKLKILNIKKLNKTVNDDYKPCRLHPCYRIQPLRIVAETGNVGRYNNIQQKNPKTFNISY